MSASDRPQGWDKKAVNRIAKERYGSLQRMFEAHGWATDRRTYGQVAPTRVVEAYGTVEAFVAAHQPASEAGADIWDRGYSVLLTSLWGWSPETWGSVGWSGKRGLTRRENLLRRLTDPFLTVCYVTSNVSSIDRDLKGKIAGFYVTSHQRGDRDDFSHPIHHIDTVEKWRHSTKAVRAFSFLPERRLPITALDPTLLDRARSVSAMGEILTNPNQIALLRNTPYVEVECYGQCAALTPIEDAEEQGWVRAGPARQGGYVVSGGVQWLPRELYILRLSGNAEHYLGESAGGREIVKVGLAASPDLRRQSLQKAMPKGAFRWELHRTTRRDGHDAYPSHAIALRGEDAMKRHLSKAGRWLGGEFYLADSDVIETAWELGREAASARR